MPVPDAQILVWIVELLECVNGIPWLEQSRGIVYPNLGDDRIVCCLRPNLYRFHLIRVARLNTLILARPHLVRVNDEPAVIPEAYRIAEP